MQAEKRKGSARSGRAALPRPRAAGTEQRSPTWFGGGTAGNEWLTASTGVLLVLLLAVIGVSIVRIGQLLWLHLFVGLLLVGPVALKLASTGYRFVRYYTSDPVYRSKGPPELGLRLIAPVVVISTLVVFVSGIVLLFQGPANRGTLLLIHKVSFFVWLAFTGLHLLGHLPGLGRSLGLGRDSAALGGSAGAAGRWLALTGAVVGGLVLAIVLIPHFGAWTAPGALPHHHHHLG